MAGKRLIGLLIAAALAVALSVIVVQAATAGGFHGSASGSTGSSGSGGSGDSGAGAKAAGTSTPIQHVVVIFGENISFDHYFGTYPSATNADGVKFSAAPGTPAVDGLLPATSSSLPPSLRHSDNLLTSNPNSGLPQRLDFSPTGYQGSAGGQLTCDQDHNYSDEQKAFDSGKMDKFIESVGTGGGTSPFGTPCQARQVMDYYDGNTVTGLWNYAQNPRATCRRRCRHREALLARGDQPRQRRHGRRRYDAHGQQPIDLDLDVTERRPHARRPGWLLADQRCAALLG